MKKYIMTSPAFTGEAKAIYGPDDKLILVDLQGCDLDEAQTDYFLKHIPALRLEDMKAAFPQSKIHIIEEGYRVTFDEFWTAYDLKLNRQRCERAWIKLKDADQVKALHGIRAYRRHLQLNSWKNKANPETYLKNRYWENEWK